MDGAIVQVNDDGLVVIRASGIASCTMALAAARLGYEAAPPPAESQARFDEGHLHEDDIARRMAADGMEVIEREAEVRLVITPRLHVVGHIDGLAMGRVVDFKTLSKDEWDNFERHPWESGFFPKYKWQFSVYMHATGLPFLLARKNRNSGQIEYEEVDEPFYSITDIRRRALEIESWGIRGELPDHCDVSMFPCPYYKLHPVEEPTVLSPELTDKAEKIAREHKELSDASKENEKKLKDLRRELRKLVGVELLDDGKVKEKKSVNANGVTISFYNQKNPPSMDMGKIVADLGVGEDEFAEKYKTQTESERLRITLPKKRDGDD